MAVAYDWLKNTTANVIFGILLKQPMHWKMTEGEEMPNILLLSACYTRF